MAFMQLVLLLACASALSAYDLPPYVESYFNIKQAQSKLQELTQITDNKKPALDSDLRHSIVIASVIQKVVEEQAKVSPSDDNLEVVDRALVWSLGDPVAASLEIAKETDLVTDRLEPIAEVIRTICLPDGGKNGEEVNSTVCNMAIQETINTLPGAYTPSADLILVAGKAAVLFFDLVDSLTKVAAEADEIKYLIHAEDILQPLVDLLVDVHHRVHNLQ